MPLTSSDAKPGEDLEPQTKMNKLLPFILALPFLLISCDGDESNAPSSDGAGGSSGEVSPPAPSQSATFAIQYTTPIRVIPGRTYHVVDLFDVSDGDLAKIKESGSQAIAYFSSQYEDWRPDSRGFPLQDLGLPLDDWEGERWVNSKSSKIRGLMASRLDKAKARGFVGVDVDNVDFYAFPKTGFDNSKDVALEYIRFFVRESHARGLLFSLKNAVELVPALKDEVDMFQNEEGIQYKEIQVYQNVGKPVLNVEYKVPSASPPYVFTLHKDLSMDEYETWLK